MRKTILITGATDGIGFETAKIFAASGHYLLLHGRSESKLAAAKEKLLALNKDVEIEVYRADLSNLIAVRSLASDIKQNHSKLDVLINNAGVFKIPNPVTDDGYDQRFIVNTVAPYLLTKLLLEIIPVSGRVINLSSAAQAPVDLEAFSGRKNLSDSNAYAQSKLGITMWSFALANSTESHGVGIIAVNPASFLASKMVKEAYGAQGHDLSIGARILVRAALNEDFAEASGRYFDNDSGDFAAPHRDALDASKNEALISAIDELIEKLS